MIEFSGLDEPKKPEQEQKALPSVVMTLPNPPSVHHSRASGPQDDQNIFPVGRPSKFSWDLAKTICIRIQNGDVLSKICSEESMPSHSVVNLWMKKLPKFNQMIERSRIVSADKIAEDSMTMFDDPPPMESMVTKSGVIERISMSGVQLMRYKSQAKQWLAAKFSHDKYGDKINVSQTLDWTAVLSASNAGKTLRKLKKAQQAIEVSPEETAPRKD